MGEEKKGEKKRAKEKGEGKIITSINETDNETLHGTTPLIAKTLRPM